MSRLGYDCFFVHRHKTSEHQEWIVGFLSEKVKVSIMSTPVNNLSRQNSQASQNDTGFRTPNQPINNPGTPQAPRRNLNRTRSILEQFSLPLDNTTTRTSTSRLFGPGVASVVLEYGAMRQPLSGSGPLLRPRNEQRNTDQPPVARRLNFPLPNDVEEVEIDGDDMAMVLNQFFSPWVNHPSRNRETNLQDNHLQLEPFDSLEPAALTQDLVDDIEQNSHGFLFFEPQQVSLSQALQAENNAGDRLVLVDNWVFDYRDLVQWAQHNAHDFTHEPGIITSPLNRSLIDLRPEGQRNTTRDPRTGQRYIVPRRIVRSQLERFLGVEHGAIRTNNRSASTENATVSNEANTTRTDNRTRVSADVTQANADAQSNTQSNTQPRQDSRDQSAQRTSSAPSTTDVTQADVPQTNLPQTNLPQTNAPQTNAPQTNAPQADATLTRSDSSLSIATVDESHPDHQVASFIKRFNPNSRVQHRRFEHHVENAFRRERQGQPTLLTQGIPTRSGGRATALDFAAHYGRVQQTEELLELSDMHNVTLTSARGLPEAALITEAEDNQGRYNRNGRLVNPESR